MPTSNDDNNDTLHVPAFDLPMSAFLGPQSRAALQQEQARQAQVAVNCPSWIDDAPGHRQHLEEHYYPSVIAQFRARYDVVIEPHTIAGVYTEVITPVNGVSLDNQKRILINLHGGAFTIGGRYAGQMESIPIAALGNITVISIDYRKAPEHQYPAATEDVVAVYKTLLSDYQPENIGIYGCSAGAILAGQTLAWLDKAELPLPGAIGMLSGAPLPIEGDANHIVAALNGGVPMRLRDLRYFDGVKVDDPEAFPGLDDDVVAKFPPSLLLGGTRDFLLSQMVTMHGRLSEHGVKAQLRIWDGLGHAFVYIPDLPEAREAFRLLATFFANHSCKPVN